MRGKFSVAQALIIFAIALVVAWIPLALGGVFGFGALVVTPVVMVVVLVTFGFGLGAMAPAGKWIRVAFASLVIAALYTAVLAYPQNPNPVRQMYVTVAASDGPGFTAALAAVLKQRGIDADLSQSSVYDDETWMKAYALHATRRSTWIWSSNTTMSGFFRSYADGRCLPAGAEPRPDPGQYFIMVKSDWPCTGVAEAATFFDELRRDLLARGYDVRDTSVPCAALVH